ncbi:hypothetical protein AJ79_02790 [Helicocarpus griseus UAMH5409]|uniref:Cyclochlorotine biosynthesis protein O n=1 Tax=Helicocarpus griseus UAMH5409 TaxID=1447875 RepID=A0A2B7Y2J1_9EURO|nr:hypothetical protein AJ79_02790 [Helicocarpus griseus UAMH5409]
MAYFSKLRQYAWYKDRKHYAHETSETPSCSPGRESLEKGPEDGPLEEMQYHELLKRDTWWKSKCFLIIANILLFALYGASLVTLWESKNSCSRRDGLPYSPAANILEWQEIQFSLESRITEEGTFSGKPSTELDKAWHDLLKAENIMIEPKYINHYARADISVRMPEGDGYIGTLNVYHELHCLKRIHKDMEMNRLHNEHCIDFLRQSAMCHGDVGLITFE